MGNGTKTIARITVTAMFIALVLGGTFYRWEFRSGFGFNLRHFFFNLLL